MIRPTLSFRVLRDGSLNPFLPQAIFFRDGPLGLIRPTAPFFEVWGKFEGAQELQPLTATRLEELGGALSGVSYRVSAANLKATRRTKDPACGFGAEIDLRADNHDPQALLATSPHVPGHEPLVLASAPIPLGTIQAIRPRPGVVTGADLDILRLRFTPASGAVYGPPDATFAADPGAPSGSIRQYEIVPARNRILNPAASWPRFRPTSDLEQPEPTDTFDGVVDLPSGDLGGRSWGIVDDTCDLVIRVVVEIGPQRFVATGRATVAPPDFAPDRRPFMSLADDLADRELPALSADEIACPMTVAEIADLFQRVFETVSLTNLDALRNSMLRSQVAASPDPVPHTDTRSMTANDRPLAEQIPQILESTAVDERLQYTQIAHDVHSEIADIDNMILLFRTQSDRINCLLRPPYARIADLPETPVSPPHTVELGPDHTAVLAANDRDPRVPRSQLHDMRMPPYMRDSDASPLSLTWRQHREVTALINHLAKMDDAAFAELGPVRQRVALIVERRRAAATEAAQRTGDATP
ncbi:hypothetical protein [Paraburkholderia fungorum]|uniref:hypothetical protein n=1 Tax=Paraburkholderia fungorum TaxID=134537 RepID=UPI0038B99BB3